jgi:hypothetical protein
MIMIMMIIIIILLLLLLSPRFFRLRYFPFLRFLTHPVPSSWVVAVATFDRGNLYRSLGNEKAQTLLRRVRK